MKTCLAAEVLILLIVVELSESSRLRSIHLLHNDSDYFELHDSVYERIKRGDDVFAFRIMTFNVRDYASPSKPFHPTNQQDRKRVARGQAIAKVCFSLFLSIITSNTELL